MDSKTQMELYTKIYQYSVFYKKKVKYSNIQQFSQNKYIVFNWKEKFILNSIANIKKSGFV